MNKNSFTLSVVIILSFLLAACGGGQSSAADKLAEIQERGTLIVSTDPAYPPQSQLVESVRRLPDTKCAPDQRTANELQGFDIETAKEIASRLGVEACFVTPDWTLITGGSWADRWDISVGSMTITPERMEKLYFSQPYYTTPASAFVHVDNTTFTQPSDLSGMKVGGCAGCTYDSYVAGTLKIPGESFEYVIKDAQFTGYETDINALQDLALGDGARLDGVLTASPTGLGAIADGLPLKQLGDPVYFEYLAAAFDKAATKDSVSFVNKVNELINQMHADGTLLRFSNQFFGLDLTTAAGKFDVDALNQFAK